MSDNEETDEAEDGQWVTMPQAATALGISERQVYRLVSKGKLRVRHNKKTKRSEVCLALPEQEDHADLVSSGVEVVKVGTTANREWFEILSSAVTRTQDCLTKENDALRAQVLSLTKQLSKARAEVEQAADEHVKRELTVAEFTNSEHRKDVAFEFVGRVVAQKFGIDYDAAIAALREADSDEKKELPASD